MLAKRIIPCLDVKNGRVVKGLNFEEIQDAGDPVTLAKSYDLADELVFLDITASIEKRDTIKTLASEVAQVIDMPFTIGGGVNTIYDAREILLYGADKVGINTGAVNNPNILHDMMKMFGRQCVVVAIDVKRNNTKTEDKTIIDGSWFEVFTHGGKKATGLDAIQWAKKVADLGAGEILLTSIDKDGTRDGYDIPLTRSIVDSVSVPVIASGGCGKPEHILELFQKTDVSAALAASIFHYNTHGIYEVKKLLEKNGIPVRL